MFLYHNYRIFKSYVSVDTHKTKYSCIGNKKKLHNFYYSKGFKIKLKLQFDTQNIEKLSKRHKNLKNWTWKKVNELREKTFKLSNKIDCSVIMFLLFDPFYTFL